MAALLALYLGFTCYVGIVLILDGAPASPWIGAALLVLAALGAWYLIVEIVFLMRGRRVIGRLAAEDLVPDFGALPRLPSGRVDPTAGEALFPPFRVAAEAAPDDWRAWGRLSLAYDAAGDRPRARWAMRRAIALAR